MALLKELMLVTELNNFYLVGGTALSLYYGHRISIDLDLFSTENFKSVDIIPALEKKISGFSYRSDNNPIGLFCFIDDIKVDFVKHHIHPLIAEPKIIDGIRIFNEEDIIAMKVMAILKRGVKKDFFDIAELLKYFSVTDFINFYTKKYPSQQLLISIPSALIYFADAEESEDPVSLNGKAWNDVKKFIQQKVSEYLK